MESTSVYWIPVYQILEARGLESLPRQRTAREERAGPEDRCLANDAGANESYGSLRTPLRAENV